MKLTEHIQKCTVNMNIFEKKMSSIDLPAKIGKKHHQNPVLAITS